MTKRKDDRQRAYAPYYVSAETLAYLLDYSPSTIDACVKARLLPKPMTIAASLQSIMEQRAQHADAESSQRKALGGWIRKFGSQYYGIKLADKVAMLTTRK